MKLTLKAIRAMHNLTQEQAAKEIGVSTDTWRNYELQKTFPDVPIIKKIEDSFDVSYNDIIFLPLDYGLTVKHSESLKQPV